MKKIITLCILILLTAVGYGSQPQQPDYNKLMLAKGFPADYAEKLAVLKKRWSQWVFEPLFISRMEKRYTWDHVLFMETDQSPRRSLISGSRHFAAYFHNSDLKEYDTGCRRASRAAVAYFLDPRNFLNERDIFQFEKLSFSDTVNTDTVRLALKGTFMEKGILENGKSYAEWLCIIGRELNINALFLACRIRQEQGLHGSPLVSGRCGDLLADYYRNNIQTQGRFQVLTPSSGFEIKTLEQLNGFYNYSLCSR